MQRGWLIPLPDFHAPPLAELRARLRFTAHLDYLPVALRAGDRVVGWRDSPDGTGRCVVAEGTVESVEQGRPAAVHAVGPALRARWNGTALIEASLVELLLADLNAARPVDLDAIELLRKVDASRPVAPYAPASDSPAALRQPQEEWERKKQQLKERQAAKQKQNRKRKKKSGSVWTVSGGSGPYIPGRGKNW